MDKGKGKGKGKLWGISGIYLAIVGIIHSAASIAFTHQVWAGIFADGVFNTVNVQYDRNAALFSICFGALLVYTGICWHLQIRQQQKPLPKFYAWGLLVIAAVAIVLMPASGFWLVIPLGLIMLWPHLRKG